MCSIEIYILMYFKRVCCLKKGFFFRFQEIRIITISQPCPVKRVLRASLPARIQGIFPLLMALAWYQERSLFLALQAVKSSRKRAIVYLHRSTLTKPLSTKSLDVTARGKEGKNGERLFFFLKSGIKSAKKNI